MFEVGQVFKKNGIEYCVVDILQCDNKDYLLISNAANKIDFEFFEVRRPDDNHYELLTIHNDAINNKLFDIFYNKMRKEEKNG